MKNQRFSLPSIRFNSRLALIVFNILIDVKTTTSKQTD